MTPSEKAAVYQAALEGKPLQHKPIPGANVAIPFDYWAPWHSGNGIDIPIDPKFYWDKYDYRIKPEPKFEEVALFRWKDLLLSFTKLELFETEDHHSWPQVSDWVKIEIKDDMV